MSVSTAHRAAAQLICRRHRLVHAVALALCAGSAQATTYSAATEMELVQAIANANSNAGADVIDVTADIVLSAALPTITDALTITGSGGQRSITRDDTGANACSPTATNAFRLIDASADLTLSNLALSGGCNLADQGGAVRVQNAALNVMSSTISGNQTFFPDPNAYCYGQCIGGGLAVLNGSATVVDSHVTGNTAHAFTAAGGGIAAYQTDLTVTRSTISGNNALDGPYTGGGGIYATGVLPNGPAASLTIGHSTIAGNVASYGGGVGVLIASLTIADSHIADNRIEGTASPNGGGVFIQNGQLNISSRITRSLISGNSIIGDFGFGAGVRVAGGPLEIADSAIVNNSVTAQTKARAGGIMVENAAVTIANSTLSGNSVNGPASGGGAIMVDGSDDLAGASLDLRNSTVTGNSSNNSGGGIYIKRDTATAVPPTATIESSIVAGNQGGNGLDAIGAEPATPAAVMTDHSLIQGSVNVGAGTLDLDATTVELWNRDPLLLPLSYNGGVTPTHALAPASPAIDRGSNTQNLTFDQRGAPYTRALGAAADIGAYEYDSDRIFAAGFE